MFARLTERSCCPGFAPEGDAGAPDSWFSSVQSESGEAEIHVTGAVCVDDAVSTSSRIEREEIAGHGGFAMARAECPAGTVAVGGGVSPEKLEDVFVTQSTPEFPTRPLNLPDGPVAAPTRWSGTMRNDQDVAREFAVVAVCQDRDDVSAMVASDVVGAGPGAVANVGVECPDEHVAIGGGVDPENVYLVTVTGSEPLLEGTSLFFVDDGRRSAPTGWYASVRNDTDDEQRFAVTAICVPEPDPRALAAAALGVLAGLATLARRSPAARRWSPRSGAPPVRPSGPHQPAPVGPETAQAQPRP